uniref:Neurotransmitter-gated ion-channel ligand-binding domain-containing protein n=1 Tax=Acrobeloides nanus TaxID=290746 RepID=A0A914D4U5_9BILA
MGRPHYGRFWWFIFLTFLSIFHGSALVDQNRQIEQSILKDYNKRHRPVKSDSKQMTIPVFLMINHVEKVDELEQTMLLHGLLWATWEDEYLRWEPSKFNNTNMISIESWKIWQPSFALYNR